MLPGLRRTTYEFYICTSYIFFTGRHETHKTNDNYVIVTDLKNKALQCEFGDLKKSLIRDRIVCGILNEACRARKLREAYLKLVKCIEICRSSELSEHQLNTLHHEPVAVESAHAVAKQYGSDKNHEKNKNTTVVITQNKKQRSKYFVHK